MTVGNASGFSQSFKGAALSGARAIFGILVRARRERQSRSNAASRVQRVIAPAMALCYFDKLISLLALAPSTATIDPLQSHAHKNGPVAVRQVVGDAKRLDSVLVRQKR